MGVAWCPILGTPCRDDCAWADVVVTITDDGMERDVFCCVAMLSAAMIQVVGSAEGCEHGLG